MKRILNSIAERVVCHFAAVIGTVAGGLSIANSLGLTGSGNSKGEGAAASQGHYYDTTAQISQEQWNQWNEGGLPLLKSLAAKSQEDRTAQETALSTGAVKDQFAVARASAKRALNLGPGGETSDRAAAVLAPSYMDEAAQVSGAISTARRGEQARQFNEGSQVLNTYRGLPAQAISGMSAAGAGAGALSRNYTDMARLSAEQQAQGVYGGVLLARNAKRWFGSTPGGTTGGNIDLSQPDYGAGYYGGDGSGADQADFSAGYYRDGGVVAQRYANGGWIQGAIKHPGALHRDLGIPEGQKIPHELISAAAKRDDVVGRRARLALTLGRLHANGGPVDDDDFDDEGQMVWMRYGGNEERAIHQRGRPLHSEAEHRRDSAEKVTDAVRRRHMPETRDFMEGHYSGTNEYGKPLDYDKVTHEFAGGGAIRGPGSGTSDSIKASVSRGSYILSADTVRAIGIKKVDQLMEQAGVRPSFGGGGGEEKGGVPVRLSNGEYQLPPEVVQHHGEEFFNKLQEKYHRPVMNGDGLANGGVIRKRGLPREVEDAIFRSMPEQAIGKRRIHWAQ